MDRDIKAKKYLVRNDKLKETKLVIAISYEDAITALGWLPFQAVCLKVEPLLSPLKIKDALEKKLGVS